jgi:hypothetical protein
MVGALFCGECGTQLIFNQGIPTTTIETSPEFSSDANKITESHPPAVKGNYKSGDTAITLNLLEVDKIISLGMRKEATLGRVGQGQPIIPDIDLTPFKAYEAGVSRMHASLKIIDDLITVTDLGSVNGTRINGKKISAHIPYPVNGGDILTLGRLKVQILLNNEQKEF